MKKMNILLNVANAKQLSKHSVSYYDSFPHSTLYSEDISNYPKLTKAIPRMSQHIQAIPKKIS